MKILDFLSIRDIVRSKNCIYFFIKRTGQRMLSLFNLFNILIYGKTKSLKILVSVLNIFVFKNDLSLHKTRLELFLKRIRSLLNVFNILICEVYQQFDKYCIRTLKIGKFVVVILGNSVVILVIPKTIQKYLLIHIARS